MTLTREGVRQTVKRLIRAILRAFDAGFVIGAYALACHLENLCGACGWKNVERWARTAKFAFRDIARDVMCE